MTEKIRERYIRPAPTKGAAKNRVPKSMPLTFLSSAGLTIYVGRNNEQNDRLTRSAPPDALWLHVKDAAGSHQPRRVVSRIVRGFFAILGSIILAFGVWLIAVLMEM